MPFETLLSANPGLGVSSAPAFAPGPGFSACRGWTGRGHCSVPQGRALGEGADLQDRLFAGPPLALALLTASAGAGRVTLTALAAGCFGGFVLCKMSAVFLML